VFEPWVWLVGGFIVSSLIYYYRYGFTVVTGRPLLTVLVLGYVIAPFVLIVLFALLIGLTYRG
jgi:hypothetical protein